jgi:chromatin segregation and condensation protein Rec8/ScpA/Scc1 (kleisin family)
MVATFLALLELVKCQAVRARQDEAYGEILLFRGPATAEALGEIT